MERVLRGSWNHFKEGLARILFLPQGRQKAGWIEEQAGIVSPEEGPWCLLKHACGETRASPGRLSVFIPDEVTVIGRK